MTDESNSKRLDRVEADIKELRADFREDVSKLHGKMDAILSAIAAMQRTHDVGDVHAQASIEAIKSRLCPRPGACVELAPRIDKLEARCSAMHDMLQQVKGGGKVISGIWGAIGASVIGGIFWLITHFASTGR